MQFCMVTDELEQGMKKHIITSKGGKLREVLADKYELRDGFFNFYTYGNDQLFTFNAEYLVSVEVKPANPA